MNFRQIKAIEASNKKRLEKHFGQIPDTSGIYILTRYENGFKYAYIGQAKRILTRLAGHLKGYQHIDLSLKKHKLYSPDNETGWRLDWIECDDLEEKEKELIEEYANKGYQLRNKTSGGQGKGKNQIADFKPHKGYRDGLKQGEKNTIKEINRLLKYHDLKLKKDNKISQRMNKKLHELLDKYKKEQS